MATDYLTEDTLLPSGQKFICISFLTDKENKTSLSGIKVRGAFATYEDACAHAKKLQDIDPYNNVFVGEMGKWLPFDPAPDSKAVQDSEYANQQLNQMMKAYIENQEKAKVFHEQRKTEMIRKNIMENLTTRKDNLQDVKKKMKKASTDEERKSLEMNAQTIEEQIKLMEDKRSEIDVQLGAITEQVNSFSVGKDFVGPKVVPEHQDDVKEE